VRRLLEDTFCQLAHLKNVNGFGVCTAGFTRTLTPKAHRSFCLLFRFFPHTSIPLDSGLLVQAAESRTLEAEAHYLLRSLGQRQNVYENGMDIRSISMKANTHSKMGIIIIDDCFPPCDTDTFGEHFVRFLVVLVCFILQVQVCSMAVQRYSDKL
jgi:hypothetical protein